MCIKYGTMTYLIQKKMAIEQIKMISFWQLCNDELDYLLNPLA